MGELEALVRRNFQAVDAGHLDEVAAALNEDCEFVAPGFSASGREAVFGFMAPFLAAFPDIAHRVSNVVEGDGGVAFELEITGTHTQPLMSPGGEIPPTGKPLRLRAANLWRVSDGSIASYHVHFDQLDFLTQLGLAPGT